MLRLRFLILALSIVGALSQPATLRAQDNPDELGAGDAKLYLPAILQGGAGAKQESSAATVVHLTCTVRRSWSTSSPNWMCWRRPAARIVS